MSKNPLVGVLSMHSKKNAPFCLGIRLNMDNLLSETCPGCMENNMEHNYNIDMGNDSNRVCNSEKYAVNFLSLKYVLLKIKENKLEAEGLKSQMHRHG